MSGENHINLRGAPPDPNTFDGPLNVFIQLHGTAVAHNAANQTKKDYDTLNPAAVRARTPESPPSAPPGQPISAGRKLTPDPAKYVIDRRGAARSRLPRPY